LKIPRPILYCLIILLVISTIYFLIPKYEVINHSGRIFKVNRLTGQITPVHSPFEIEKPFRIKKPSKILVSPDSPIGKYLQSIGKTPDKP